MAARPTVRYTYRDYLAIPEVEVFSPSTRAYDRDVKRKRYLDSGVPEVWTVDADERSVEVWSPELLDPERPRDVLRWQVGAEALRVKLAEVFE